VPRWSRRCPGRRGVRVAEHGRSPGSASRYRAGLDFKALSP
jgi:hypothetical protein